MIERSKLTPIATILKIHGIHGELNCKLDIDAGDLERLPYVFVELDGLMVPFFIRTVRTRGGRTALCTFADIDTASRAAKLEGCTIYSDKQFISDNSDVDGYYLSDLLGWQVFADGRRIGILDDYDDSTSNLLMIIRTDNGELLHIPAADEFFSEAASETQSLYLTLPTGLLEINKS